jgi:hypothetical protein
MYIKQSIMYTLTRQDTAEKLWISTRSVDRYIKSGKLRSKKDGKIIFIHTQDVTHMIGTSWVSNPEVIIPDKKAERVENSQNYSESSYTQTKKQDQSQSIIDVQSRTTLEKIYLDLRSELQTKDKTIQDLSVRLGQAQEIAKNSVSLIEFKKSQYLLEESKWHLSYELEDVKNEKQDLEHKLKYEKSTNYILITFCIILVIGVWTLWFLKI